MDLYTQHFRGRVLTIVSDCSYSGSWVREAMAFMDEQGVGPCGHVAKEKGILVKVVASCLANDIPAELAFSTHCAENNASTGIMSYTIDFRSKEIHNDQHPSGLDFTELQCKNKIDQPCAMVPGSTWGQWIRLRLLYAVRGLDRGQLVWNYIILKDDEEIIQTFLRYTQGPETGTKTLCLAEFGKIVKRWYGQNPPTKEEMSECVRKEIQTMTTPPK